jgi:hypothetical protein
MSSLTKSLCMKGMEIQDSSKTGGVGDIHVIDPSTKLCCMVESKNYESHSVPTKEV